VQPTNALSLNLPVSVLAGVGPARSELLGKLGISTVRELLLHPPRRYEDRRKLLEIAGIQSTGPATVRGTIVDLGTKTYRKKTRSVFEVILDDGTGRLHCRWWNMPYMEKNFAKGQELLVAGRVKDLRPRTIDHPETERIDGEEDPTVHVGRIVPVYPLTEGLNQRWLRGLIWRLVFKTELEISEPLAPELVLGRPSHREALRMLHFPDEMRESVAARQRFALEEFIALQVTLMTRRRNLEAKAPRLQCGGDNRLIKRFLPKLGFELTEAQKRVLREIRAEFTAGIPMRRLLQGDVGSGKTAVAACAALMVIESGLNVALMAPTEILAEQHFRNFTAWFSALDVPVNLRTGAVKTGPDPAQPDFETRPGITIGTHALIQGSFQVEKLGLAVIDEQHRFGVAQREALVRKGQFPHLLVMTATPIPRTLGLTLYGDLDISVLDELPPGRKPVKTFVRTRDKLPKVWEFVRKELSAGHQAYVVFSRVEDDSQLGTKAVLKEEATLRAEFSPFRVAAMHGKLRAQEKEEIMSAFRQNKVQVLLASSLIEVGVDVPNATVMIIENAEQFGLAQLHQLRGRIGRGAAESFCILVAATDDLEARARLNVLEKTSDGFQIAEADLKFRGPGELLGTEQTGLPNFRFGNLLTDMELIREAREIARRLMESPKE
jgi:ATP-dependent DNA helicase RecG